jgi:uncharacterized protein
MTSRPVQVDTGPLVALLNRRDQHHGEAQELVARFAPPFYTTWPVLAEAAWLLRKNLNAVTGLLQLVIRGDLRTSELNAEAVQRISEVLVQYHSLGVQLADASLVHSAELLQTTTLLTFDLRDFSVIRLADGRALELNPSTSQDPS